MEKKSYYAILGVSPGETQEGVRAAFIKLAKEHHPDVSGPEQTRYFQEITEAYLVLSRSESRKAYDATLPKPREEPTRSRDSAAAPGRPGWGARRGEPIEEARHGFGSPVYRGGRGQDVRLRFEPFDFFPRRFSYQPEIEVLLTREEARRGGILPLRVPVEQTCPICRGRRTYRIGACSRCGGRGEVLGEQNVRVRIPAGIEDGAGFELRVRSHRGEETAVILRFVVE